MLQAGAPSRGRPPAAALLVALLVVVLAWVSWWDGRERSREFGRLSACAEAGQRTLASATGKVTMMSRYVAPSLASSPAPRVRDGLHELMRRTAAEGLPSLRRARDGCATVSARPWHRDLGRARVAYLAHLDGWIGLLTAASVDDDALSSGTDGLVRRRLQARDALVDAAPGAAERRAVQTLFGPSP